MSTGTKTTYTFEDLVLEGGLFDLQEQLEDMELHIRESVPDEILFTGAGEPNVRNRFGAMLLHIRLLRTTLRSFL